jgi:hypothetical protein
VIRRALSLQPRLESPAGVFHDLPPMLITALAPLFGRAPRA